MRKVWIGATLIGALFAVSIAAASAQRIAAVSGWQYYSNARYDYSFCYPTPVFRPGREPDAHDGIAFTSVGSARLVVWGAWEIDDQTWPEAYQSALDELAGGVVTYKLYKPAVSAVSGEKAGRIFYSKRVRRNETIATFAMSYPASQRETFRPIVEKMFNCLRISD